MLQALIHGAAGPFMILLFHLCCSSAQKRSCGNRETAQQLRSHVALAEDEGSAPSTHAGSNPPVTPVPGAPTNLLTPAGYTSTQVHRVLCDLTFCPTLRQSPQQRDLRGFPVACDLRFEVGSAFYPSPWSVFKMLLMQGKFP